MEVLFELPRTKGVGKIEYEKRLSLPWFSCALLLPLPPIYMTRTRRFISGVLASYLNIGANVIYTLASVPIAISYLNEELFGLWALAAQMTIYLSLLEIGLGIAITRCIADHKDCIDGPQYAKTLSTGGLVFIIQGILIAALGYAFSWVAPLLFTIPSELMGDFRLLIILLSLTTGISIALRSVGSPLWAFQRIDIINYGFSGGILLSLGLLWLGFTRGLGVLAFPLSQIPPLIITSLFYWRACKRFNYFPTRKNWFSPSWAVFREFFSFGKDTFFVQLGRQAVDALQLMIVGKFIGLSAAATYAISIKTYTMSRMLLAAPISTSEPALAEMHVRGESETLARRYQDILLITLFTATIVATGITSFNRHFVLFWTGGKIQWEWTADLALGLNIICKSVVFALINAFGVIKNYSPVRFIYLFEGLAFLVLGIAGAIYGGLTTVIAASTIVQAFIILPLLIGKGREYVGANIQPVRPLALSATLVAVSSLGSAWLQNYSTHPFASAGYTAIAVFTSSFIAYRFLLPATLRAEAWGIITPRFPKVLSKILLSRTRTSLP